MASMILQTWQFVVVALAGWMNQQQQDVVAYLREEDRVLREQLGDKRIRFTDDQPEEPTPAGKGSPDCGISAAEGRVLRLGRNLSPHWKARQIPLTAPL